jgi:hypothetical protein
MHLKLLLEREEPTARSENRPFSLIALRSTALLELLTLRSDQLFVCLLSGCSGEKRLAKSEKRPLSI